MSGLFVTFEGLDGCGKTTQIKILAEYLLSKGKKILTIREPGGTNISEKIRNIILDVNNSKMSYTCEMLLYAAARAQLVDEVIKPALKDGTIVLCDRFIDSSFVYQGIARGLGIDKVKNINNIAIGGLMPDLTLFFDVPPNISLQRRMKENVADRIEKEKLDFHNMVYEGYKKLACMYKERIKIVDANCEIEDVTKNVIAIIHNKLATN